MNDKKKNYLGVLPDAKMWNRLPTVAICTAVNAVTIHSKYNLFKRIGESGMDYAKSLAATVVIHN